MKKKCQQINTVSEWLIRNEVNASELARRANVPRQTVAQAKRLGHLVVVNSQGKPVLVPATYREAFE